jgi:DNA-binding LytR/AlgR family response regulator
VHRSFIARLDKIQSIDSQNVILENEKKVIPVGGSFREELMQKLNTL